MRADRLLSLLMLLQSRDRVTARELAERLEVSERTIYWDLEAFSAAGIPVYTQRGPGGGCALLEGYRAQTAGLTGTEARALFLAVARGVPASLGLGTALERALLKVLASLPASTRREAEHARQRLHVDTTPRHSDDVVRAQLATIQGAIWNDRRLVVRWHAPHSGAEEEQIDPYGLVARAGEWFLVGAVAGAVHVWPVSWIRSAALIRETFDRAAAFDLEAYWTAYCAEQSALARPSRFRTEREGAWRSPILASWPDAPAAGARMPRGGDRGPTRKQKKRHYILACPSPCLPKRGELRRHGIRRFSALRLPKIPWWKRRRSQTRAAAVSPLTSPRAAHALTRS